MMLNFTLEYKAAICNMTSNINYGLRKYELDWDEWAMVKELHDLLKVSSDISLVLVSTTFIWTLQVFKHATDLFSCSELQTLPWLSLWWTTLTTSWQLTLQILWTQKHFRLHKCLQRRPSTVITHWQITPMSIGLPWVHIFPSLFEFNLDNHNHSSLPSTPSWLQAQILQANEVAQRLYSNCTKHCQGSL